MIHLLHDLIINSPGQLGCDYTSDDGLGLFHTDEFYEVTNCTIDMSCATCDEAVAITWGASAVFTNCKFSGAEKLVLCGSGDKDKRRIENKRRVIFNHCLFEDFGRRGPEVQSGMVVEMNDCVIRNWGVDDYFSVRNFAAWAHDGGMIIARNCVFYQEAFSRSLPNFFSDVANHIGQHVNDAGLLALLKPSTYTPGVCRGLIASDGGYVEAHNCFKNKLWIRTDCPVVVDEVECLAFMRSFSGSSS